MTSGADTSSGTTTGRSATSDTGTPAGHGDADTDGGAPLSRILTITNARGLHARASARFVKTAEAFDADIRVTKDGQTVSATSIMGLMMLAASTGSTIALEASGPQAQAAMDALEALVTDNFGEE
ncbi:HPr family phosphocarrier protein [Pyruvatibacter mobilis]|jgi:phosphocarrier protein|uniref:HPr family phosphocarrier protein n=1 Tax=Pyruvatibacter mobilis TaxID=1712261 RepID=UPI0004082D66